MLNNVIRETMENNSVAAIIISISIMLFLGFALTRITKKLRLPNVTAYILTGILIGPFVLDLIPQQVSEGMDFLSDIALAFIAFSTGEFFTFSNLKKNGAKVVIITVFEACLASVVVFIAVYFILGVDLDFAVVLSALASATAPASTMMTIRQTNARGNFVDTLLQTVALDDVIGLIEYSVAISVALALSTGKSDVGSNVILPILMNLGILVLGGLFGFILKFLMPQKRSTDNRLIISVSILFAFSGSALSSMYPRFWAVCQWGWCISTCLTTKNFSNSLIILLRLFCSSSLSTPDFPFVWTLFSAFRPWEVFHLSSWELFTSS